MILVGRRSRRNGKLNRATWETVAAAQQLAAAGGSADAAITIVVPGSNIDGVAAELAAAQVQEIVTIDDPALASYTPDGYTAALQQAIAQLSPSLVLLASHLPDPRFRAEAGGPDGARAHHRCDGGETWRQRTGLRPADVPGQAHRRCGAAGTPAACRDLPDRRLSCGSGGPRAVARTDPRVWQVTIDAAAIRQTPEAPFQEARQSVDLSQAERIVSVGRGIKGQEHLALAQQLADALGAELGASRPICDAGWLPMDRQVGSSGQTVAPKVYVALGISGAIQHLVGMKGSNVVVAINKDPDAPIFEIADYGIVGDLFEVVPAMIAALKA